MQSSLLVQLHFILMQNFTYKMLEKESHFAHCPAWTKKQYALTSHFPRFLFSPKIFPCVFSLGLINVLKLKTETSLKISWVDKTSLVIQTKLNVAYFARLIWPGSSLAYGSWNHKENLNCFPRLIQGNHCRIPDHLGKF